MQRVIEKVLMIHGVEFAVLDQIDRVSELEHRDSGRLQYRGKARDKVIDCIDMRHHIVGDYHISQ